MRLYDLLQRMIKKMPKGWGETVQVDLTNGWTAPSDGIVQLIASGRNDTMYVSKGKIDRFLCVYCYGGGSSTTSGCVRKGDILRISYKGTPIGSFNIYFTPFAYRGGFSRLAECLQSLTFKGVMA